MACLEVCKQVSHQASKFLLSYYQKDGININDLLFGLYVSIFLLLSVWNKEKESRKMNKRNTTPVFCSLFLMHAKTLWPLFAMLSSFQCTYDDRRVIYIYIYSTIFIFLVSKLYMCLYRRTSKRNMKLEPLMEQLIGMVALQSEENLEDGSLELSSFVSSKSFFLIINQCR